MDFFWQMMVLFSLLLILFTGYTGLPLLWLAWYPSQIRSFFVPDEKAQSLIRTYAPVMDVLERLKSLGFAVLGVKAEKTPLWGPIFYEVSLTCPETSTYASVMISPKEDPSFYFYTPLPGGMVYTSNQGLPVELKTEKEWAEAGVKSKILETYDLHRQRLAERLDPQNSPAGFQTQADRLEATRFFYTTTYSRQTLRQFLKLPPVRFFFLSLGFGVVILISAMIYR